MASAFSAKASSSSLFQDALLFSVATLLTPKLLTSSVREVTNKGNPFDFYYATSERTLRPISHHMTDVCEQIECQILQCLPGLQNLTSTCHLLWTCSDTVDCLYELSYEVNGLEQHSQQ